MWTSWIGSPARVDSVPDLTDMTRAMRIFVGSSLGEEFGDFEPGLTGEHFLFGIEGEELAGPKTGPAVLPVGR